VPPAPPDYLLEWLVDRTVRESKVRVAGWIRTAIAIGGAASIALGWLGVRKVRSIDEQLARVASHDSLAVARAESLRVALAGFRDAANLVRRDLRYSADSAFQAHSTDYSAVRSGVERLAGNVVAVRDHADSALHAVRVIDSTARVRLEAVVEATKASETVVERAQTNDALLESLRRTALLSWTAVVTQGSEFVPFGGSRFYVRAERIHRAGSAAQRVSVTVIDGSGAVVCSREDLPRNTSLYFRAASGNEVLDYVLEQLWATKQGGPWYRLGDSRLPDLAAFRLRRVFEAENAERMLPCGVGGSTQPTAAVRTGSPSSKW
jgi:hypothetical protein